VSPALAFDTRPVIHRKKPKNIIFCVADGMAIQVPTMVDYIRQLTAGEHSYLASLLQQGYTQIAFQETRSLSSVVTDSSAAASTWGSGRRIWNGMTNMYPDKTKLRTLTEIMSEAGVRCGLVTTTTMSHATPSGFAVCSISRGLEEEIVLSYLKSGVDVLFGGGDKFFNPAKRKDKVDAYGRFASAGFKIARNKGELAAFQGSGKHLGIFSDSHLPYSIDRMNSASLTRDVPTLAEMTRKAIDLLKGGSNGFLLQVEGGKVDHACHGNDLPGAIYEQIDFEEAVKAAVEFAIADGETLVIITSDHATGGPSLNGDGPEYFDSTGALARIPAMKASVSTVTGLFGRNVKRDRVQDVVLEKLAIKLSNSEADAIASIHNGGTPFKNARFYNWKGGGIGAILGNHMKVTWTSGNHTCDHVLVAAVGPGSEAIRGIVPNVKFFDLMLGMKELSHSNPTMGFLEAQRHMRNLKTEDDGAMALELDTAHGASHHGLI